MVVITIAIVPISFCTDMPMNVAVVEIIHHDVEWIRLAFNSSAHKAELYDFTSKSWSEYMPGTREKVLDFRLDDGFCPTLAGKMLRVKGIKDDVEYELYKARPTNYEEQPPVTHGEGAPIYEFCSGDYSGKMTVSFDENGFIEGYDPDEVQDSIDDLLIAGIVAMCGVMIAW